jgi:hypothetical protein
MPRTPYQLGLLQIRYYVPEYPKAPQEASAHGLLIPLEKKQEYAISYRLSHYEIHALSHCKIHTGIIIPIIITITKPKMNPIGPSRNPGNMSSPISLSIFYDSHISYY